MRASQRVSARLFMDDDLAAAERRSAAELRHPRVRHQAGEAVRAPLDCSRQRWCHPPAAAGPSAERDQPLPGSPPRRRAVLLAEDNAVNQMVAVGLLEQRGHPVDVGDPAARRRKALDGGSFDVVLMDVQMPEMDGFEAVAAIRAEERARRTTCPSLP